MAPPPAPDSSRPSADGEIEALSCEAAVERALAEHPALAAARAGQRVEWARADAVPRIGAFEVRVRDELEAPGDGLRARVRWRLPTPGREGAQVAAARERAKMSAAEILLLEAALARDVRMRHLAVRMARHAQQTAAKDAELMEADAQWRKTRVKGGMETELSAQTAVLRARDAQREQAAARRALTAAEAAFAHDVGGPADASQCADGPPPTPVADHPRVRAALARARAVDQEGQAEVAANGLWPRFLELTWDRQEDTPDRTFLEVGIPLSLTGPALADVRDTAVARAKAELLSAVEETQRAITLADANLRARVAERDAVPPGKTVTAARAVATQADAYGGDPRQRLALQRALLREEAQRTRLVHAVEAASIRLRAARGHR